ncbi:hypothetical protein N7495_007989 [Penicillium taxi]|uniref:uncharacterized protein n=1 Tax=Penicillium taxi TaxID=168475 RepID=UPI0025457EC0|nr:uncharacterized protein N7495_007989 [Penicillium taxi]KAJ5887948.1 hypothetical protein N7495_007989 [Penicillium taxi]
MTSAQTFDKIIEEILALPRQDASAEPIWYCIAASAYTSANASPLVVEVYKAAIKDVTSPMERRRILQRILETMIKGTLLYGIPRLLNAFYPLVSYVEAEGLLEGSGSGPVLDARKDMVNPFDLATRGLEYFRNIYRDETENIFAPMYKFSPDIHQASVLLEYGPYLSETSILNPIETSQITIAALLPLDVAKQVKWHMRGLIRNEGTELQAKYALDITKIICEAEDVRLKGGVPDLSVCREKVLF